MQITSPYADALCTHCEQPAIVQISGGFEQSTMLLCIDHADKLVQGVTEVVLECFRCRDELERIEIARLDLDVKPPYP